MSINLDFFLQLRIKDLEEKVEVLTATIESMVIEKVRGMQQVSNNSRILINLATGSIMQFCLVLIEYHRLSLFEVKKYQVV